MTFGLITPIVDPLGPEGAVASVLSRDVEPFLAEVSGYDTVSLSWDMPIPDLWDGYYITRSRSGFPRTYDDGMHVVSSEATSWNLQPSRFTLDGLTGGWHYFSFFLKDAFGVWVKVAEEDALVPYDYGSTDKMWDTIPEHYKVIRDSTADLSLVNLRINPDLYDGVSGGSQPNLLLSAFVHVFGWGFDFLRTQAEQVLQGYDPLSVHPSRLKSLAQQFGFKVEESVSSHVNRTVTRNLASLYRNRGTLEGIKDIVTAMSGWDAEVSLGYNFALSKSQTAMTYDVPVAWSDTKMYTPDMLVKHGDYLYRALQPSLGFPQAPPASATSNAYWEHVAWPRTITPDEEVGSWQVRMSGVGTNDGYVAGYTRLAAGVPDPTNMTKRQYNALQVFRDTSSGTNGATWLEVLSVPGIGFGGSARERVINYGIPLPRLSVWDPDRTYLYGDIVTYAGQLWQAANNHVQGTTPSAAVVTEPDWKLVADDTSDSVPVTVSVKSHGPFVGATGAGRPVRVVVRTYSSAGELLDNVAASGSTTDLSGPDTDWTTHTFSFRPHPDAVFMAMGARVEGLPQATTSNLWEFSHYFTDWQTEVGLTQNAYEHPRQVHVRVRADRRNLAPNPTFSATYGTGGWTGASATLSRDTTWRADGALKVAAAGGSNLSYAHTAGYVGMVGGRQYTVSATVNTPVALTGTLNANARRLGVEYVVGGTTYTSFSTSAGPVTGEARVAVTVALPSEASQVRVRLYNGSSVAGQYVLWDDVLVEEGAMELAPFHAEMGDDYLLGADGAAHYYENRLDRTEAIKRALRDAVPLGLSVGEPEFATWD